METLKCAGAICRCIALPTFPPCTQPCLACAGIACCCSALLMKNLGSVPLCSRSAPHPPVPRRDGMLLYCFALSSGTCQRANPCCAQDLYKVRTAGAAQERPPLLARAEGSCSVSRSAPALSRSVSTPGFAILSSRLVVVLVVPPRPLLAHVHFLVAVVNLTVKIPSYSPLLVF